MKDLQIEENNTEDVELLTTNEEARIVQSIVGEVNADQIREVLDWARTVMLNYCCFCLLIHGKATVEHQGGTLQVTSQRYHQAEYMIDDAGEFITEE